MQLNNVPDTINIRFTPRSKNFTTNIRFTLGNPIVTVFGDSGAGKTYLCDLITALKSSANSLDIDTTFPLDSIEVISNHNITGNSSLVSYICNLKDKLVIIDRFNFFYKTLSDEDKHKLINYMNQKTNNYILMFRGEDDYGLDIMFSSYAKVWIDNDGASTYIEVSASHFKELQPNNYAFDWDKYYSDKGNNK